MAAEFLQNLLDSVREELARIRNRPFLEAAMAASALIATADMDDVTFSERSRMDAILDRLEVFRLYDAHDAVELFNGYVDTLRDDPAVGTARAITALEDFRDQPDSARLLVRVALAMAQADGAIAPAEQPRMEAICQALGLSPAEFGI